MIRKTNPFTSKKLNVKWSIEEAEDIKALHGLDIEGELTNLLTMEVEKELQGELPSQHIRTVVPDLVRKANEKVNRRKKS